MWHDVKIDEKLLGRLRMLADWQLRDAGFEPTSVTTAVLFKERVEKTYNAFVEAEAERYLEGDHGQ